VTRLREASDIRSDIVTVARRWKESRPPKLIEELQVSISGLSSTSRNLLTAANDAMAWEPAPDPTQAEGVGA
jgi:hypothetical protein